MLTNAQILLYMCVQYVDICMQGKNLSVDQSTEVKDRN